MSEPENFPSLQKVAQIQLLSCRRQLLNASCYHIETYLNMLSYLNSKSIDWFLYDGNFNV